MTKKIMFILLIFVLPLVSAEYLIGNMTSHPNLIGYLPFDNSSDGFIKYYNQTYTNYVANSSSSVNDDDRSTYTNQTIRLSTGASASNSSIIALQTPYFEHSSIGYYAEFYEDKQDHPGSFCVPYTIYLVYYEDGEWVRNTTIDTQISPSPGSDSWEALLIPRNGSSAGFGLEFAGTYACGSGFSTINFKVRELNYTSSDPSLNQTINSSYYLNGIPHENEGFYTDNIVNEPDTMIDLNGTNELVRTKGTQFNPVAYSFWYKNVTGTYHVMNNSGNLYLNNQLVSSINDYPLITHDNQFIFGYNSGYQNVSIDEFMVFNASLSLNDRNQLYQGYNNSINFTVKNPETLEIITDPLTIDIFNSVVPYADTLSFSGGNGWINGVPSGSLTMRVNVFGEGYDSNTLYLDIATLNSPYNVTLYLSNATSTGISDILLHVSDEGNIPLEGAEIFVYALNSSSGTFYLVTDKITNINGETLSQLVLDSTWYKFSVYYQGQKCYETATNSEFKISSSDTDIYFTCKASDIYITDRDLYNAVTTTLSLSNTSNVTGSCSYEGSSTTSTNFCLEVWYKQNLRNNLLTKTCSNGTGVLITENWDFSSNTSSTTLECTGLYLPSGGSVYDTSSSKFFDIKVSSKPVFGNMGLYILLVLGLVIIWLGINEPRVILIGLGFEYFIATFIGIIKIPYLSQGVMVGSGILMLLVSIIISFAISKRTGE